MPTLEQGNVELFESGAIVLHIAEQYGVLLPDDPAGRARAVEWMFAALNTVEPPISDYAIATLFEADQPWSKPRLPSVIARIDERLDELSARLDEKEWLDGAFSAGDLLMVAVLGLVSTITGILWRWWQRPSTMVMSDDWMSDQARLDAKQGWN